MLTIHAFFMRRLITQFNDKQMNKRCGSNQCKIWSLQKKSEMQSTLVVYEYDLILNTVNIKEDTLFVIIT